MPNRTPKPRKAPFKMTHRSARKFSPKDGHLSKSKARNAGVPPTQSQVKANLRYPVGSMGYARGQNRSGRGGHDEFS